MARKGRARNGNTKLRPVDVLAIRDLYAKKLATRWQLAERFGVSKSQIDHILRNENWWDSRRFGDNNDLIGKRAAKPTGAKQ
jgi:hypothetical protein